MVICYAIWWFFCFVLLFSFLFFWNKLHLWRPSASCVISQGRGSDDEGGGGFKHRLLVHARVKNVLPWKLVKKCSQRCLGAWSLELVLLLGRARCPAPAEVALRAVCAWQASSACSGFCPARGFRWRQKMRSLQPASTSIYTLLIFRLTDT